MVIRGSRFRAWLGPAADAEEAGRALARRAAAGPDATHHCWAYRVWRGGRVEEAGFDAGEPGGTAGRPILGALQAGDLLQAVCVVSRWFGGVRLGTGGLVRAYADAANAAIDAAREAGGVLVARQQVTFRVRFQYPLSGAVQRVISRFEAHSTGSTYGELVELELRLPLESADAFDRALADATAGTVSVHRGETRWEPVG
ncbi:MAG TPA: YigZ family protein [Gemmatimonadota bacterium]|nr:YigZ family protein [Gemmatimonadota bacterium]